MKKIKKYRFYLIAVVSIIAISTIALLFINYNANERLKEIEKNLRSIAELKTSQVSDWLSDRMGDARTLQNSPNYRTIKQYLLNPGDKNLSEEIIEWLSSIKQQFDYDDVWLLDINYNVIISLNGGVAPTIENSLLNKLISQKQVYFSDLQRHSKSDSLFFEIIVPLLDENENIYCFLNFCKDPHSRLFPMIQYWPVSSRTAETILFRIEDDSIVFLNELKFKDSVPLNFKLSDNDISFWGSKDVINYHGLIDSRDYRDEEVLALIKKIPNYNWYLKIKANKAELLAPIRQETTTYILMLILVAALILLFVYQLWKMKNITHLEKMLELESEKNKLQKVYDQISQNANDSIFMLDENLRIIEANEIATKTYGYSKEEFLKLSALDIRVQEDESSIFKDFKQSEKGNGAVYITRHKKINGAIFPAEVSLSSFVNEGMRFFISVVRDITERVDAEKKIQNLNRLYTVLSRVNTMLVRESDEQQLFSKACNIIAKYGNYGMVAIVSKADDDKLSVCSAGCECDACLKIFPQEVEKFRPLFKTNYSNGYIHCRGLNDDSYIGPGRVGLLAEGFKSALYVPIFKSASISGALIVFINDVHFFDDVTIDLFKELAGDLSYAITSIEKTILKDKAELLIKENERKLSTIVQNMPGVVYRCKNDKNWTMEFISKNIYQLCGWTPEDLINNKTLSFNDLIHPDDRKRIWEEVQQKIGKKTPYNLEYRIVHKNGTIKSVSENAVPVFNSAGKLEAIEGIIFDITELEETKIQLEETEERYKNLVDNSALGIAMANLDGKIIIANSAIAQVLGRTPEEIIGKNFRKLSIDDPIKVILLNRFVEVVKTKETIDFEEERSLPAGKMIIHSTYAPVFKGEQKLIGVQLILRDVTSHKAAEANIRKLSQSIEQNPVSVLITNLDGDIEYANPALVKQTGYELDELIGKNPRIFKSGLMEKQLYTNLWNTIKSGKVFECEMLNKKKSGELYWEKATIAPIKNQNSEITNFVALKEDITQKKMLEDELRHQRDKAEEMNRVKTYFFNNMSHELRTPMVGILGYLELLLSEEMPSDQRGMLTTVMKSSRRLHQTLNEILDLSKIESAETAVRYGMVSLVSIFKESTDLFFLLSEDKNIFIKTEIEGDEIKFVSDENLLSKTIINLLNNAIKYTNEGGVYLRGRRENANVVIEVEDTGIGIEEKYFDIIFEPFRQVSEGLSRTYEGTGLGLSIAKSNVELLGGTISVQSKSGSGTKLTINLPNKINGMKDPDTKPKTEKDKFINKPQTQSRKTILLVEDDSINAGYVNRLLNEHHSVEVVSEGSEAIVRSKAKKYDLILMDIGLKGEIDGVEAAQKIKKDSSNSTTPIIALTAFAMVGDREKILKAGLDDYLSKPFTRNDFFRIVEKHLSE